MAALAGGFLAWLLAMLPGLNERLWVIDRSGGDWMLRLSRGLPERDDLVFLGIDDASLTLSGLPDEVVAADESLQRMKARFPWDRRVYAAAVGKLAEAGARLVILDLLFGEPSEPEADAELAAVLARHRDKVVLAADLAPMGGEREHMQYSLVEPLPDLLDPDETRPVGFGYVNFRPGDDGVVREVRYVTTLAAENGSVPGKGEEEYRSLAAEALRMLGKPVPRERHEIRWTIVREPGASRWSVGNAREAYAPRPVRSIFLADEWRDRYGSGAFFRDKVVIIGPAAQRFQDQHQTPVGMVFGPQLHLQALASGLAGATVQRVGLTDGWIRGLLGAAGVGLACVWVVLVRKPLLAGVGALLVLGLLGAAAAVWGITTFQLVSVATTVWCFAAATVTAQSHELFAERIERGRLTREFRRFVSRDVADALVKDPGGYVAAAAGRRRQVVVLFTDIRGFTGRSETANPEELVDQLNEYLTEMVAVVFRHGGTLDKFIGDAVMAHWGALDDAGERAHAAAAIAAAVDMLGALGSLNGKWAGEGRPPFRIGVGLHLGEVIAGELGSPERTEFGVIGDAVNLASRIEGLTKYLGVPLLVSGETFEAAGAPPGFRPAGRVRVKGRAQPVSLFALAGGPGDEVFREGLRHFECGDFASAAGCFAEVLEKDPDDGMAAAYWRWAEEYRVEAPEEWDGVIAMDSK